MNLTDKNRAEALHLIRMAEACIQGGEGDRAIWRLLDAAGVLAEALGPEERKTLCGIGPENSTGRGYHLGVHPLRRSTG